MSRYIDADALMEKMKHRWERFGRESDCICLIEDAPTIDAIPVQIASWVSHGIGQENVPWGYNCSRCGKWFVIGEATADEYHYCPNCGAKMDGERKDGDG